MSPHKLICVPEYGYLVSEEHVTSETRRVIPVPKSCFEQLLNFVQDEEHEHSDTFLKPALFNKKPALQVKNYVGLIQTSCGTQIEILPKLTDKQSHEKGRALLLKMLRALQSDMFKDAGDADVKDKSMPLLEVYIQQFLILVQGLVKRGIRSDYIQVQKNSAYLKGRLLVGQQLIKNTLHPERFFIRYQEYQINRPANRLIKTTLLKVIKLTRRADNQRLARELGFVFQDVPKSHNISLDFKQVKTDRSMGHYNDVLAWCQLLLNGSGPTAYAGSFNTLSLLYPMERLFEDYVAHHLKQDCKTLFGEKTHLTTQVSNTSLVKKHEGKSMFRLKPDLLIRKEKESICVMDTKWKLVASHKRGDKYNLSQSDFYQLFAYGHKYLTKNATKELVLIYPKTDSFEAQLPTFFFEDDYELKVIPFDLENDKLMMDKAVER